MRGGRGRIDGLVIGVMAVAAVVIVAVAAILTVGQTDDVTRVAADDPPDTRSMLLDGPAISEIVGADLSVLTEVGELSAPIVEPTSVPACDNVLTSVAADQYVGVDWHSAYFRSMTSDEGNVLGVDQVVVAINDPGSADKVLGSITDKWTQCEDSGEFTYWEIADTPFRVDDVRQDGDMVVATAAYTGGDYVVEHAWGVNGLFVAEAIVAADKDHGYAETIVNSILERAQA